MPAKKNTVQALLLTQKAEVKEIELPVNAAGVTTLSQIQTLLKKKEAPEILGSYAQKANTLFLLGYTSGKAGTENKHELPPPHDTLLCFGDIILLATKDSKNWSTPIPFKMADYETFYTKAFGGFEDLNSEDEEEVEEVEEVEEAEEEVVEEEEEEEVEEAEVVEEEEEEVPIRVPKKKKRAPATPVVAAGAAQVYASYLHVSAHDELLHESFDSPYNDGDLHIQRQRVLKTLHILFNELLTNEECSQLERCIYNGALRNAGQRHIGKAWSHNPFVEMYQMFAKHISANFHPSTYVQNTELYARYKAGEVSFKDISEMDTYQLFEERWKDSFMQQQVREKRQLEGNKAMATDQFLCMRCHKRECTYYEMQTRSADEPMTIFITCLNCGKHWRQ
jgi:DNA-directed RNA polymerase subunit M/transcription elongation factor TFIIS